jgi:hypothetical protein
MSANIYDYIKTDVAAALLNPPDTEFQRGYLASLLVLAEEALGLRMDLSPFAEKHKLCFNAQYRSGRGSLRSTCGWWPISYPRRRTSMSKLVRLSWHCGGQGFHAEHLLFLIDEASGIPDVVFEVGMGALSTPGAKVLMAGNPTRASGFFYETHHSLRSRWQTMHVSCLDVPRAQGHIEDIRAKYGEGSNAWRVRVLGEFPTADDETVIPLELVLSAVERRVSTLSYYPVWGVDVARYGDDRTALAKRQANRLLEPIRWWHSTDLMAPWAGLRMNTMRPTTT